MTYLFVPAPDLEPEQEDAVLAMLPDHHPAQKPLEQTRFRWVNHKNIGLDQIAQARSHICKLEIQLNSKHCRDKKIHTIKGK